MVLNSLLSANFHIAGLRYNWSNDLINPFFRVLIAKNEFNGKLSLKDSLSHFLSIFPCFSLVASSGG